MVIVVTSDKLGTSGSDGSTRPADDALRDVTITVYRIDGDYGDEQDFNVYGEVGRMRRNRGGTLTEYLISLAMSSIVIGGAFWLYADSTSQANFVDRYNDAEMNSRQQVDLLLDHIRNAQTCKDAGHIAISAGTATSLSYYGSDSTSDVIMYSLSGTNLVRSANSASKTVLGGVSSLEFTYYVISSGSLVTTSNPNAPTTGELSSLAAIEVEAMANVDGIERKLAGIVRLRNSPYKTKL